jgi:hypothetical protein
MKVLTIQTIRSYRPCYDPSKHLSEDWTGTVLDIVMLDKIPWEDRLWVVMRSDLLSDKLMRLFAVWCARQVQHLMTDARSLNALDVAEKFANGLVGYEELNSACDAARAAAAAAWAAWADAAADAARAAWAAARAADAAADAARADAAWAAWAADAARAAWAAARAAQKDQLVLMILDGIETGDVY